MQLLSDILISKSAIFSHFIIHLDNSYPSYSTVDKQIHEILIKREEKLDERQDIFKYNFHFSSHANMRGWQTNLSVLSSHQVLCYLITQKILFHLKWHVSPLHWRFSIIMYFFLQCNNEGISGVSKRCFEKPPTCLIAIIKVSRRIR